MIPGSAAVLASLLALLPGPAVDARCTTHAPRHADVPDRAGAPESSADPRPDDELRTLFRSGVPYGRFLDEARNRVELWQANSEASARIDADLVQRAGRAVEGEVAFDGCLADVEAGGDDGDGTFAGQVGVDDALAQIERKRSRHSSTWQVGVGKVF